MTPQHCAGGLFSQPILCAGAIPLASICTGTRRATAWLQSRSPANFSTQRCSSYPPVHTVNMFSWSQISAPPASYAPALLVLVYQNLAMPGCIVITICMQDRDCHVTSAFSMVAPCFNRQLACMRSSLPDGMRRLGAACGMAAGSSMSSMIAGTEGRGDIDLRRCPKPCSDPHAH